MKPIVMIRMTSLLLLINLIFTAAGAQEKYQASVSGYLETGRYTDTVTLSLHREYGNQSTGFLPVDTTFIQIVSNKRFIFEIPLKEEVSYISLQIPAVEGSENKTSLVQYMIQPSDSVHLHIGADNQLVFSGSAAAKFRWRYNVFKYNSLHRSEQVAFTADPGKWLDHQQAMLSHALKTLDQTQGELSPITYSLLKADALGSGLLYVYRNFQSTDFGYAYSDSLGKYGEEVYKRVLYRLEEDTAGRDLLASSAHYASYLLQKTLADMKYQGLAGNGPTDPLALINEKYPDGILKDKLIAFYFFQKNSRGDKELLEAEEFLISTVKYKEMLKQMANSHIQGEVVDNSAVLKDKNDRDVLLADFRGKVVYIDLWFTGCAGCISAARALPKVEEAFSDQSDIVFLSVSTDKDRDKWLSSIQPLKDVKSTSVRQYSHYITDKTIYLYTGKNGYASEFIKRYNPSNVYPCMLIIDKKGRLFSADPPRPEKEKGEPLIRALQAALKEG